MHLVTTKPSDADMIVEMSFQAGQLSKLSELMSTTDHVDQVPSGSADLTLTTDHINHALSGSAELTSTTDHVDHVPSGSTELTSTMS